MFALAKSLSAPLASLFILIFAGAYYMSFIAIRMKIEDSSVLALGLISFAYYLGFFIGAFVIERMIKRIGHIRSFTSFANLYGCLVIAMLLIEQTPFWIFARFCHGISIAGIYVIIESWLLVSADNSQRGRALALYTLIIYSAPAIAQQMFSNKDLLAAFNPTGHAPFALVAALCSLSAIPVSLKKIDCPQVHSASLLSIKKLFDASMIGIVTCFFSGIVVSVTNSLMPYYFLEIKFSVEETGQLMLATYIGSLTLQWPVGMLSDFFDRRKTLVAIITASFFISIIVAFGIHFFPFPLLLFIFYLFGGLAFSLYPIGLTQICDELEKEDIISGIAVLLVVFSSGTLFGTLTAPIFMQMFTKSGLILYIVANLGILFAYSFYRLPLKKSIPAEEQGSTIILPGTSIHVAELSDTVQETMEENEDESVSDETQEK